MARGRKAVSSPHAAKQRIYEQFAVISKALASPVRLELLDLLVQGERSVESIAAEAQLSVANASQHLQVLAGARLVESRRQGHRILYVIADRSVEALWQQLRRTAEQRLVELESVARDYLVHNDDYEPIDRAELLRRLAESSVTLIDVRSADEFAQGHLPGAISVPLDQLDSWAQSAPKPRHVVAYCRGPYCVLALQALDILNAHGIAAEHLSDGVGEWRVAGLPIERD
jgi:rhodanese-related sulfurtransferase/DNA-binding transcriptional ArsR family regulator